MQTVATAATQLDTSAVRERVFEVIRTLLGELGSQGALPMLHLSSQLDRELGLGSLERVELLTRLENAFGLRLPDSVASEANSPEDLVRAILAVPGTTEAVAEAESALRAVAVTQKLHRDGVGAAVFAAETLVDVLRYRATHNADQTHLLVSEDGQNGEKNVTLTFGELYAAAQRFAEELARRGVPAGGRVALMLPTSRAFFISFAGILQAGAVPVPIYPPFRADRIEEYAARQSAILNNAEVCMLLTFRRGEAVAKLLRPRVRSLDEVADAEKVIEAADNAPPPAPGVFSPHLMGRRVRKGNDLAMLQYTSGSTGDPKGVMLTHANLLANIRALGRAVGLGPGDVAVSWLPLYHDMGLIGAWLTPLHFALPVAVMSPLAFLTRPEKWLHAFHRHRGTIAAAPNFAYELCVRKIADKDIQGVDLSSWRAALNGAEPVNPETLERFAERFAKYGFRHEAQLPVYGLAESTLGVTVPPLGRRPRIDRVERETFTLKGHAVRAAAEEETAISFVSSGRPLPGHEVRIADGNGDPLPERREGFLWFRGPSATRGYYRNPKATAALLPQGAAASDGGFPWVNSGDRAYRAEEEIYVTGRVKDIIIKGGRNLYPHEVEGLAMRAAGIRKGCVVAFGLRDEDSGTEKLVVAAETREREAARRTAIAARVTELVSQGLGLPPDRVELIPPGSIPKTSSGKLRREETKQLYVAGRLSAGRAPAWVQIVRLGTKSGLDNFGQELLAGLKRGLEILYGLYTVLVFALWIVPAWTFLHLIKDPRAAGHYTSSALKILVALAGCRVRVFGKENMDVSGPKVFAANHTSYVDVLLLVSRLDAPYRFIAKREVRDMPFVGAFLERLGHLKFDRSDPEARLREVQEVEELLRRGESVFFFPEGTFSAEAGVRPFQLGAFKASVATGAPIVPISLDGTRKILRDGTYLPRPGSVKITVHPPIYPRSSGNQGSTDDGSGWRELIRLRDTTREVIARDSGEPLL
ncbi:MAG TPA: AMP-binding protein [Candidatus Acidoferrum sp.]